MADWIRIKLSERQRSAFECSYVSEPDAAIEQCELVLTRAYQYGLKDGALVFLNTVEEGEYICDALLELVNLNSDIAEGLHRLHRDDKDARANARADSRSFDSVLNRVRKAVAS